MIRMRNIERAYTVLSRGAEHDAQRSRTKKTITVRCPFCSAEVKCYVWSLSGGGKLCACGAKFERSGKAFKVIEVDPGTAT